MFRVPFYGLIVPGPLITGLAPALMRGAPRGEANLNGAGRVGQAEISDSLNDLRPDQDRRALAHRAIDLVHLDIGDGDAAVGPILARELDAEKRELGRRGRLPVDVDLAAGVGAARRRL